jgi:hypothetical protein
MLIPILFWISIPLSIFLSVFGVLKNKYWLVLIGAVLFFPISYYFNGSPNFHGYGLFLPVFHIISAAAVKEEKTRWAWLFLLPAAFVVCWFIYVVLLYQFSTVELAIVWIGVNQNDIIH